MKTIIYSLVLYLLFVACVHAQKSKKKLHANKPPISYSKSSLTNPGQRTSGYSSFEARKSRLEPLDSQQKEDATWHFVNFRNSFPGYNVNNGFFFDIDDFNRLKSELNPNTSTYEIIRVYPAITAGRNPKIYLVFFGEQYILGYPSQTLQSKAFVLRSDDKGLQLGASGSSELTTAISDVRRFLRSTISPQNKLNSLSFTISQMDGMFNVFQHEVLPGYAQYGVRFYPAYNGGSSKNKIYFVGKAENKNNVTGIPAIHENGSWYNHMDACPPNDDCPDNPIIQ